MRTHFKTYCFLGLASATCVAASSPMGRVPSQELTHPTSRDIVLGLVRISKPKFSPDGKLLNYHILGTDGDSRQVALDLGSPASAAQQISPSPTTASSVSRSVAKLPWIPESLIPCPSGGLLAICREPDKAALYRVYADGRSARIDLGNLSVSEADIAPDGSVAAVASSPSQPPELYLVRPGEALQKLTDLNAKLAGVRLGMSEVATWRAIPPVRTVVRIKSEFHEPLFTPGLTANGIVTYPRDYEANRKYPLLVVPEPDLHSSELLDYDPLRNLLADSGCIVLFVNYRGCDNLGRAFQSDGAQDSGNGQAADIEAGIRQLEAKGVVDPYHVLVFGWSRSLTPPKWLEPLRKSGLRAEFTRVSDRENAASSGIYDRAVNRLFANPNSPRAAFLPSRRKPAPLMCIPYENISDPTLE